MNLVATDVAEDSGTAWLDFATDKVANGLFLKQLSIGVAGRQVGSPISLGAVVSGSDEQTSESFEESVN